MKAKILALVCALNLLSCSKIQLREQHKFNPDNKEEARKILFETKRIYDFQRLKSYQFVKYEGYDIWFSSIVRMFTPLEKDVVRFNSKIDLIQDEITFSYKDEEDMVDLYFNNKCSEKKRSGISIEKNTNEIELYLGPFKNYLLLPYLLLGQENSSFIGSREVRGKNYFAYFVEGSFFNPKVNDQFIFFIDREFRVRFVLFTLRDLFESYSGLLKYSDFQVKKGLIFFDRIYIGSDLDQPEWDHIIRLIDVKI